MSNKNWGIASALSKSSVTLETFDVEVEGPTMEEMERMRREENEAEYARLMEIRKMLEKNPDWVGQLEKEIRSDEDSDMEEEEEEEEEEKIQEEEPPQKKKKRRRRKKKTNDEDATTLPSEKEERTLPSEKEESIPVTVDEPKKSRKRVVEKEKKKTAAVPEIQDPKRTVYVGNLSYDAEVSSIQEGLASVGTVDKVHIIKNNKGRGAGFAYVTFKDEGTAKKAVRSEVPISIDGRDIRVKAFDPDSLYRRNGKRKAKRKRNV